ncbi:MAG: hypothetical protein CM1200mP2_43630 [Planctomycetaceae bacterium]|nr:MAG: hypothetical protein CM1200mP2_43630 [Planctomycetaceae bacterium]
MSGLAVADGRVVTLVESGTKQQVWALDFASGKTLWKTDVAAAYRNGMGNGARATPTIAGGRVVVSPERAVCWRSTPRRGRSPGNRM